MPTDTEGLQIWLERVLPEWLPKQRWFGARPLGAIRVLERLAVGDGGALLVVVAVGGDAYTLLVAGGNLDAIQRPEIRRALLRMLGRSAGPGAIGSGEQSNTSVVFDRRYVLKIFRRVEPGVNPDEEVPRGLRRVGFLHAPACLCALAAGSYTVAALHEFVANEGNGWAWLTAALRQGHADTGAIARLGRRTGEMHLALARAFGVEAVSAGDCAGWEQEQGVEAEALAARVEGGLAERLRAGGAPGLAGLGGTVKARVHGDYHLGQVLRTGDDFAIFDFEGEPMRPLEQRRLRQPVLKDVAGMLRSLDYAAQSTGRAEWLPAARRAFLDAYYAAVAGAAEPLLPADPAARDAALAFFERGKAIYELTYELNYRPSWAWIPRGALERDPG